MAIRILSSLLVALALAIAPTAMTGGWLPGAAKAAVVAADHGDGHCRDSAPAEDRKAPVHMSCASSCAAVAPAAPGMCDPAILPPPPPLAAMSAPLEGLAPERETPPPRTVPKNRT
jgi:hypothetical protein